MVDLPNPTKISKAQTADDGPSRDQVHILTELDESFNIFEDTSFADLVHASPNSGEPFQRWFRYREGFAPELITKAVSDLDIECEMILDPFCGAGSTLLAARSLQMPSIGFDVNPIVAMVARAKTQNYSTDDVNKLTGLISQISTVTSMMPKSARPKLAILDKVFRADVLDALLTTRKIIDEETDPKITDFLLTGWLSIVEGVSNVFKEGNGVKYRNRKRTKTGYVTLPWTEVAGYNQEGWALVRGRLADQYALMMEDVELDVEMPCPVVKEQSSVTGMERVDSDSVSLSIFSPPYCNNFNYMKIFKIELWMSGLVSDYRDIREISERALRSHVEMKIEVPTVSLLPHALHELVDSLDQSLLWNTKIPKTILAYFIDMREVLLETYRTLKVGGECHVVVGNSAYAGVIIPTDVLLARIAEDLGFSVERVVIARHLTTSSQQRASLEHVVSFLRESIVVLKKVPIDNV